MLIITILAVIIVTSLLLLVLLLVVLHWHICTPLLCGQRPQMLLALPLALQETRVTPTRRVGRC